MRGRADWALAGCGLIMKSWIDVETDVRAGRLVRVLSQWRSDPRPVCALFRRTGNFRPACGCSRSMVDRLNQTGAAQPAS